MSGTIIDIPSAKKVVSAASLVSVGTALVAGLTMVWLPYKVVLFTGTVTLFACYEVYTVCKNATDVLNSPSEALKCKLARKPYTIGRLSKNTIVSGSLMDLGFDPQHCPPFY